MTDRYDASSSTEDQFQPGSSDQVLLNELGIIDPEEMDEMTVFKEEGAPRVSLFIPDHAWHIAVHAPRWATRHKNIHIQNPSLSQERIPAQVCQRRITDLHLKF